MQSTPRLMAAEPTLSVPKDAAAPLPVLLAPLPLILLFSRWRKRRGARWECLAGVIVQRNPINGPPKVL